MLSTWLPLPQATALHPPQQLAQDFPISPSPKSRQLMFWKSCKTWTPTNQLGGSEDLLSGPLAVSMGVPLGSILGPTLFSVSINDVALAAGESLIHLYADDTILYTSGPSYEHCVKNPPDELQCHTTLLLWPPIALKEDKLFLRTSALGGLVLWACMAYHFAAEPLLLLDVSTSQYQNFYKLTCWTGGILWWCHVESHWAL